MKPAIATCILIAVTMSFFTGKEIASNEVYASIEAYRKANPIDAVMVYIPHKAKNPKLMVKGD